MKLVLIPQIPQAIINPVNLSLTLAVRIKQRLDYRINRIRLLKLTICIWRIVKTVVFTNMFFLQFLLMISPFENGDRQEKI